jgi:hypothetical protein
MNYTCDSENLVVTHDALWLKVQKRDSKNKAFAFRKARDPIRPVIAPKYISKVKISKFKVTSTSL